MYCGQCGKKVMETMLFCPFCGSPIVIPDQDEPMQSAPKPDAGAARPELERPEPLEESQPGAQPEEAGNAEPGGLQDAPVSLFSDVDMPASRPAPEKPVSKEEFVPLSFDFDEASKAEPVDAPEADIKREAASKPEDVPPEPTVKRRSAPKRPENIRNRSVNTYIPMKDMDPNDIFMDGAGSEDEYDDGDGYDGGPNGYGDSYEDDFDFEEPEHGGFLQRHIRGIVALLLFLILLVVCAAWALSPKGQLVLARLNLAWSAEAYADLGYEAYLQDSALLAARYYERALNRDSDNYDYAHSAMVAYYDADKIDSATTMLKKCIDLQPDNPKPYEEMLILYPDAQNRPWEITELVRMGYQRTGAESLNVE